MEETPLTRQELARASSRNKMNKGCLYENGPRKPGRPPYAGHPNDARQMDWVPGEGNEPRPEKLEGRQELWPYPGGTLRGVSAADPQP